MEMSMDEGSEFQSGVDESKSPRESLDIGTFKQLATVSVIRRPGATVQVHVG